ncbi:MAG: hypothetical protein JW822_08765 [Spirochaetales bacterium]|nr:hypothetical protein [Spirochaetales bacterium]
MENGIYNKHEAGSRIPISKMLKRYTTLNYLQKILLNKKLPFSVPDYWEDKNDTELINIYKNKKCLLNVYILCFSCEHETIHFWKTFSNGNTGCCIMFNVKYLLSLFDKNKLNHGYIQYEEINKLHEVKVTIDKIPFMKRIPYRIEEEYRVIYEDNNNQDNFSLYVDPIKCIEKIILSPDVSNNEIKELRHHWFKILKKTKNRPHKTTIFKNNNWIKYFQISDKLHPTTACRIRRIHASAQINPYM